MAEESAFHLWLMRALFSGLAGLLVFLHLLPLDTVPPGWAGPDLFVALTFAWAVRRPDFVPPLLVAGLALMMDLLFHRPPGLWAALTLVGTEALRRRAPALRDMTFAADWAAVAGTLVAITLGYRLVLSVFLVPQPPIGLSLMQLLSTLLAYPLVALVSHLFLGVRKAAPGDLAGTRRLP
ncbi:rod shape-determining protein MreD [Roseovarius autotrophicus]|uniref:rod shape-determining protein MreD n=1 Tax=Roseovarius autotrophicus TaxID=2824121 RepID=UPI0019E2282D|nr:rod shape-determining protein MreD [Roseovarius autotrophicus]MBE0454360.1 rod shape-determining protein MreD [Roseovarius sp.]